MNDARGEHENRELLQARLLVLTAAVLWSSSGFFVKAP
jgi:hypothetical protein